jgi:Ca-activated chloride channel family protein
MRPLRPTIYICLLAIFWVLPLQAEENNKDTSLAPYFFFEGEESNLDQFPLKETHVDVNISGVIADVIITQRYANQGGRPLNGRYVFPASTRAAIHGMTMTIGEQVVKAKLKRKEKAKKIFTEAKKAGKSASLLSQKRPNVFSMDVANIMPGDTVEVRLHYSELLVPTDKMYEFVFPTVVGPRYTNGSPNTSDDNWIANPYLEEDTENPTGFSINLRLATGIPIQELSSPSHTLATNWLDKSQASITLDQSEHNSGNRDFILRYRLAGKEVSTGLMLYEGEEENYYLLMMQPPEQLSGQQIPPREYLFVIDVSGSMNGYPLSTAKTLLQDLIGSLTPQDRFNVLLFAGDSEVFSPQSVAANPANIKDALRFIDKEQGGGGTELAKALQRGLAMPASDDYSRSMLVITDGYIQAEKETFDLIRENLNNSNVFTFGIGTGVNRYLIEGLAKAGLGEYRFRRGSPALGGPTGGL